MIIDLILARKHGKQYDPREFYNSVMEYGQTFPKIAFPIADALDSGSEADVKNALCAYIDAEKYPAFEKNYIRAVRWIE